ncbi:MAG: YybH family protein [Chitinophagaceae bacterium]|jgi:ketosteroid isomerase-like protein|nr:nuclear transport factor 2 family protein [Sediminibacterium sp.]
MKKLVFILGILISVSSMAQSNDEKIIRNILADQISFWNKGDIPGFMQGYWNSDSLVFVGKNGPTYGYNNTLRNYQKSYPNKDYMGILNFDILSVQPMEKDHFFVIGKFMLQRKVGDASGHFTLILRRINGVWKIVSDHSS